MTIKLNIPDKNTKQKMSGMKTIVGNNDNIPKNGFATSFAVMSTPHTHKTNKYAQILGGGGITQGSPTFFSPLHTPQNWQIAQKRREVYQWARFWYENEPKVAAGVDFYCFDPKTPILMFDGIQKSISSIEEGDLVRSHDGSVNKVEKVHKRETKEKMLAIKISGVNSDTLKTTLNHEIFTERNGEYKFIPASDLKVGDYLLTPVKYKENVNYKVDNDFAWLLGVYSAEGCGIPYKNKDSEFFKGIYFNFNINEFDHLATEVKNTINKLYPNSHVTIRKIEKNNVTVVAAYGRELALDFTGLCPGKAKHGTKCFAPIVMKWTKDNLNYLLSGFMAGDGCYNKNNGFQGVGVSKHLSEQIANICDYIGLEYSFTKTRINKENRQTCYNVRISRRSCEMLKGKTFKLYESEHNLSKQNNTPYFLKDNYIFRKITKIKEYDYSGFVYDLTVEGKHSYVANRVAVHNSAFPINGFKLECKSKKVLKYFEKVVKKLRLEKICTMISHERFLLGDVFPFKEIECGKCFPANSVILTKEGHKFIQDIKVGDMVLTKSRSFEEVVKTMSRKYEGNMINLKVQSIPNIKTTEDHEHFIVRAKYKKNYENNNHSRVDHEKTDWNKIEKVLAKDIEAGDYIASPYNQFLPTDIKEINFDGSKYRLKNPEKAKNINIKLDEDFAELMGWYVAEGSTDSNRSFSFSLNLLDEQDVAKKIQKWMLKYFDQKTKIEKNWTKTVVTVEGYSREMSAWFDEVCGHGAENKHIPWFIMQAPNNIKEAFIKGYLLGDGQTRTKRNEHSTTTVSRKLSYDLLALLFNLNKPAYVLEKEASIDSLGISRRHCYTVHWRVSRKKKNGQGTHQEDNFIFFKVKEVTSKKENTTIYNFTVNNDHTYIGNMMVTHNCGGKGRLPNGQPCSHPGGTIKRIIILNPESVEVQKSPLSSDPVIALMPDEELRSMVSNRANSNLVGTMDKEFVARILSGEPIQLSNRCVSHIKFNEKDYATYGMTMLRRLFMMLAYKQKLMTANWIISERLILPVRLLKVGDKDRPATDDDLAAVSSQLAAVSNDPNLTLVTHHAIDYDWHGAAGKIHNIAQEMEFIGKEILDGLMLNQSLLNGEGPSYGCHDEQTRVLTNHGLKYYNEVDEDDLIACYDKDSGELIYSKPLEKHEYDFDGELIRFRTNNIDMLVTPNHKMYYSPRDNDEWLTGDASEVKDRASFKKTVNWNKETIGVPEELLDYKFSDILKLYGYYTTEGSLQRETRQTRSTYGDAMSIKISQTAKGKGWSDMQNLLSDNNFNLKYREALELDRDGNECINSAFYIHNKKLAQFMEKECGSHSSNKKLPDWIKNIRKEELKELLMYMINGDGTRRQAKKNKSGDKEYFEFITISEQLRDDVVELALKCGYSPKFTKHDGANYDIYRVKFSDFDLEKDYYNLESKKYKTITKEEYKGKVWCFTTETGFFITERNGKLAIQGNSAQVGIEAMSQRLESWRRELKDWIENEVFLPIAMMQGFIDEENTNEMRELLGDSNITEWLYPTIKWNDMNLRDDSNQKQLAIQLFDKKLISARNLLKNFDIDYDQMIEEIREESILTGALGQMMGGGMGGGMGGMGGIGGLGGGMGGMGGGMGGGMDMGGGSGGLGGMGGIGGGGPDMGIPDMGGVAGGMGGGASPMGGGMGASAGANSSGSIPPGFKVGKGGKQKQQEQQQGPVTRTVPLTSLEIKIANSLKTLEVPYQLFAQYEVAVPGQERPFLIDFAYPQIGVGIECLHPDTLVLTNNGTKRAIDVNVEDKLIGRNGDYVDIVKKYENKNNNNMMSIKAMGLLESQVTDNHPILVSKPKTIRVKREGPKITRTRSYITFDSPEFIECKDIQKGDYLLVPKNKNKKNINSIDIAEYNENRKVSHNTKVLPSEMPLNKETGWLMGIYLAEGHSSKDGSITFSLHKEEKYFAEKISHYMNKYFSLIGKTYYSSKDNSMRIAFSSKSLAMFFRDNFNSYSHTKSLSQWIFDANDEFIESFLEGHCDGDGCRDKMRIRHTTSSPYLANDIQRLYFSVNKFVTTFHCKRGGMMSKFNHGKSYEIKDSYEISYFFRSMRKYYREDESYFYVPVEKLEQIDYQGDFTINFETKGNGESNHTFVVNQYVSHNCDGDRWHQSPDLKAKDAQRDQKLANIGWRILRFKESAINEHIDLVEKVIYDNIVQAVNSRKNKKKANEEDIVVKLSQKYDGNSIVIEENNNKDVNLNVEQLIINGIHIADLLSGI